MSASACARSMPGLLTYLRADCYTWTTSKVIGKIISRDYIRAAAEYTIQYKNTIQCAILTCAQKLTRSQLNPPHGTKQKIVMKKLKTKTEMPAQKKRSSNKVRGVSPDPEGGGKGL